MPADQTVSTHGLRDYCEKSCMQINLSLPAICNEFLQDNTTVTAYLHFIAECRVAIRQADRNNNNETALGL